MPTLSCHSCKCDTSLVSVRVCVCVCMCEHATKYNLALLMGSVSYFNNDYNSTVVVLQ